MSFRTNRMWPGRKSAVPTDVLAASNLFCTIQLYLCSARLHFAIEVRTVFWKWLTRFISLFFINWEILILLPSPLQLRPAFFTVQSVFFFVFFSHPFRGFFPAAICSVYSWSHNLSFTGLFVVKLPWLLLLSVMPVIVVLFWYPLSPVCLYPACHG